MRIDTSEPSLTALFNKGQVGLIRTEFMRKDDVIANTNELLEIYKKENAALAAENERLESNMTKLCTHGDLEIARLQAEVERLRKATQEVEIAWTRYENGLIETPEWVKRSQVRDAVGQLRLAAKGGQS